MKIPFVDLARAILCRSRMRSMPRLQRSLPSRHSFEDAMWTLSNKRGRERLVLNIASRAPTERTLSTSRLRGLGLKPGDEVITTAHSWISTSETITQAGGRVVFCDTEEDTFTIDPARYRSEDYACTVGIIPVHLYGQPADMDANHGDREKAQSLGD